MSSEAKGIKPLLSQIQVQRNMLLFYLHDVRPSIQARKRAPQTDVISHLISKGRGGTEILIECITYGAAGMATTQEFISLATWQLLQHPALREEYRMGDEEARYRVLHEILRLDPVIAHLLRRASSDLTLTSEGATITIPAGALVDLHISEINVDAKAVGQEPLELNPHRGIEKNISRSVMGFGTGPHRCVGEFIALAESDVFLQRLMNVDRLRIAQEPRVEQNETIKGYELREFMLTID
jgi:cytochrome P450